VHDSVFEPSVAVTVTTSPAEASGMVISGVTSFVMSSEFDGPESDVASMSGVARVGRLAAMTIGKEADAEETFPDASVNVDVTSHVPSDNGGNVHSLETPTTNVHDTVVAPRVAEIVTVSPGAPPVTPTVGVSSFVMLSVFEEPESEPGTRSTSVGADGALASMSIDSALVGADTFPAWSVEVAVIDHRPSGSGPSSQLVA
jgi:hypothetical protein